MKKIVLIFCFLSSFFSFAQNKQLLNKEWKLTYLYVNGTNETIPSNPKNVYINFNNVSSSVGFHTIPCSEIYGPVNYSASLPEFNITGVNVASTSCADSALLNFQTKYILFFNKNISGNNKFTYQINATTTGYELVLINITNDIVKFEYNFPNTDISNKTWTINSLLINSVDYQKPSNFSSGNTNFSEIINTSYFNSSQITPYYSGNYIYNIGMSTTLAEHSDAAVNNFDNLFHSFWRNTENNPFTYQINGNELVITSAAGNKAFYNLISNDGAALQLNNWSINSLKIGSQNFSPTIDNSKLAFEPNLITANYFNGLNGAVIYNSENKFSIYNTLVTIADSFNPTVAEFDGNYLENFWGKRANSYYIIPNNPFTYSISSDGNTLTITNVNGDIATYNKANLSTQNYKKIELKIYPNPVSDFITIENVKTNSLLKILDLSGKVVLNKKLSSKILDVKSLPKGIYFIEIEGMKPQKFIKK